MGRKNCNARPRPKESWVELFPYEGRRLIEPSLRAMRLSEPEAGLERRITMKSNSCPKTTGESIVREFRQTRDEGRGTMDEKATQTFQPYRVLPQPQPSLIHKIFDRINWAKIFDIVCMFLAILAIAAISGVMFFGPISWPPAR